MNATAEKVKFVEKVGRREFTAYVPLAEKIGEYSTLEVSVEYSMGGMNYFSGNAYPRGYRLGLKPCSVGDRMVSYTMMSGDRKVEGGFVMIEGAAKYNAKRLAELAKALEKDIELLAEAYGKDDLQTIKDTLALVAKTPVAPAPKVTPSRVPGMQMITKEIEERLPALYSQENKKAEEVKVIVKFFDPTGSWTWYATEGEKTGEIIGEGDFKGQVDYKFFGFVKGFEGELGYFTLGELSTAKQGQTGMKALPIERDIRFGFEKTLAEVMKEGL